MNPKIEEYFSEISEIVESPIDMNEANSRINIYEGQFKLIFGDEEISILGEVYFDWFPSSGVKFSGTPLVDTTDMFKLSMMQECFNLIIKDSNFGECFITNTKFRDSNNNPHIKGIVSNKAVNGDRSIKVQKVRFALPNLRELHGDIVKRTSDQKLSSHMNRLKLDNEDYLIVLDKAHNYDELKESLNSKGGYILMYGCELISKKVPFSPDDLEDTLHCFNSFISLLNGRRTSAHFIHGIFEEEVTWCDYTSYFVDAHKNVNSWVNRNSLTGINEIWNRFYSLWKNNDDKHFLISAIHWYVEANGNSGFAEGSIIMAQTALELIYNWFLIENKKILIGKDSENISASNKIRLLLSHINISYEVPPAFIELKAFVNSNKDILDAPDSVVQIRNAIVHSQQEKRKKLSAISYKAKYEALQLCLSYIELSLLYILGYKEEYYDRCSGAFHASAAQKKVPWVNNIGVV